jgi:hypothetical protein
MFTIEQEPAQTLPLLDVLMNGSDIIKTNAYRKLTHTGQCFHNSHDPHSTKQGIIRCLDNRTKTICTDQGSLKRTDKLFRAITRNRYLLRAINRALVNNQNIIFKKS